MLQGGGDERKQNTLLIKQQWFVFGTWRWVGREEKQRVIIDVKNEAGTCGNLSRLAVPVIDGLHCFLANLLVNLPLE